MTVRKYSLRLSVPSRLLDICEDDVFYDAPDIYDEPKIISRFCVNSLSMDRLAEEYTYLLCFNTNSTIIGIFEVSHGNVNTCLLCPREIYIRALAVAASYIVIVHNHVSGSVIPSVQDDSVTEAIFESGQLLHVRLEDSIIIGTAEQKDDITPIGKITKSYSNEYSKNFKPL